VAVLAVLTASCDDSSSRTTATVEAVQAGKACIRPEDRKQTDLNGCFPVTEEDANRLRVGQCIDARVPNHLDDSHKNDPLRSIKILKRRCK